MDLPLITTRVVHIHTPVPYTYAWFVALYGPSFKRCASMGKLFPQGSPDSSFIHLVHVDYHITCVTVSINSIRKKNHSHSQ